MRLTLLHNPKAGSGDHSADTLRAAFRAAGYEVGYQSTKADDFARALDESADVVVVAGGDGAVAKVATRLVGRGLPLVILPLGTANNIATSLGVATAPDEVIASLRPDRLAVLPRRRLDVATARAPWDTTRFIESAGVGLLGALLRDAEQEKRQGGSEDSASSTDEIATGRRRLRRVLERVRPRSWQIEADGVELSGEYTMVEVVNTRFIGPRVTMVPDADVGDGYLHLALLREEDHRTFEEYLAVAREDVADDAAAPVRTHLVRRVRLGWHATLGHVDDEQWPDPDDDAAMAGAFHRDASPLVDLSIDDAPIEVLVPRGE